VPSVGNRTNDPRPGFLRQEYWGGTFLVTTNPRNNRVSPTVTPPMIVAPAAIHAFLSITMGFAIGRRAAETVRRMARRDDAHVRPDHPHRRQCRAAKIIKSAVLIYENIAPDTDVDPPVV